MAEQTYLVTGAHGCIGAWAIRLLREAGKSVVATDLGVDPVRPRLLMGPDEMAEVTWDGLDVTDTDAVNRIVAEHGITRIIHLAGLQIPFCRANPPLGAAVNVTGTVNVFEAARQNGVKGLAYASSLAALGPREIYDTWPLPGDALPVPQSLYGVYKVANEQTAGIYATDWGVGSVGLRPYTVYGVGRDQGMTADMAKAILAASIGRPFHIRFGGEVALQHAQDVARIFIAAAETDAEAAHICNLRGDVVTVEQFIKRIKAAEPTAQITYDAENPLPFPSDLDDSDLSGLIGAIPHTSLDTAIAGDLAAYRALVSENRIDLGQLDA